MLLLSLLEPFNRRRVLLLIQVGRETFAVISHRLGPDLVNVQLLHLLFRRIHASKRPKPPIPRRIGQKLEGISSPKEQALPRVLFDDPAIRRTVPVVLLT